MSKAKFIQENGETILPITHEEVVLDNDGKNLPSKYQQKQDENLLTDAKTIVGAINELSTKGGGEVTSDDVKFSDGTTVTDAHKDTISYIEDVEAVAYENKADIEEAMTVAYENKADIEEAMTVAYENKAVIGASELATNDKTLTGAINELFQSANNGKQLIADAIGEPLDNNDTFSAMSNDINGLLSTFKTNMMNNGITVESGDKFKQLIDKIATMADSEVKGVQFAEGMFNVRVDGNFYVADVELNFEPSIIILRTDYKYDPLTGTLVTGYTNILYNAFNSSDKYFVIDCYSSNKTVIEKTLTQTGNKFTFSLNLGNHYTLSTNKYYAFGVGEEDTTLRDSLADILENKGVEVTEDEDMASLITKVDSIKSGGLDIITASSLPTSGKDNQICVITSDNIEKFAIPNLALSTYSSDIMYLCSRSGEVNFTYENSNQIFYYNFYKVTYNNSLYDSYFWLNNQWNLLTKSYYNLLEEGASPSDVYAGGVNTSSNFLYQFDATYNRYCLRVPSSGTYNHVTSTSQTINFDNFSKVEVEVRMLSSGSKSLAVGKSSSSCNGIQTSSGISGTCIAYTDYQTLSSTTPITMTFDISRITGSGYLVFYFAKASYQVGIYNIKLYN